MYDNKIDKYMCVQAIVTVLVIYLDESAYIDQFTVCICFKIIVIDQKWEF